MREVHGICHDVEPSSTGQRKFDIFLLKKGSERVRIWRKIVYLRGE